MILKVSVQNQNESLPREVGKTMKVRECGKGKEFILLEYDQSFLANQESVIL